MLRTITGHWGIPFVLVEGNAELTPARLIGHHNPAHVLREDHSADNNAVAFPAAGDVAPALNRLLAG